MKKAYLFFILLFSFSAWAQWDYQKIWSTYYFPESTRAFGSVIDNDGNIIVVGAIARFYFPIIPSTEFHPSAYYEPYITPNAHQTTISEDNIYNYNDGFITKFSPDGGVIWSTFLGGSKSDGILNVAVDNLNNIYITGLTHSSTAIATDGAFISDYSSIVGVPDSVNSVTLSGNGFLSKFNASGSLQWSTYIPHYGGGNPLLNNLALLVTNSNAIYIAGGAIAGNNSITTAGAFQENFHTLPLPTSYNNGFILKFDGQGNRLAGTYFGSDMSMLDIATDSEGSIIIVGFQNFQSNEIIATPGSYQPTKLSSIAPGFIAKFSPDLSSKIWCTYYGNTDPLQLNSVSTLGTDIYFSGRTNGSSPMNNGATTGAFSEVPSPGFMAKLNGAGNTRLWGTYLPFLATSFNVNRIYDLSVKNNKLYMVGKTSAMTGVSTTGAYQENYVSVPGETFATTDTFIMQFSLDGARNWGTYFGGLHDDSISSINVTENGSFYISGYTSSTSMIATPNSLQPNLIVTPTVTYERITNMFLSKFGNPLGVTNFTDNNLKIVPNPNNGRFVLSGNLSIQYNNLSLLVYDNLCRVIARQDFSSLQTAIYKEINFSGVLAKGVYFAKLSSGNELLQTFKILVE